MAGLSPATTPDKGHMPPKRVGKEEEEEEGGGKEEAMRAKWTRLRELL